MERPKKKITYPNIVELYKKHLEELQNWREKIAGIIGFMIALILIISYINLI